MIPAAQTAPARNGGALQSRWPGARPQPRATDAGIYTLPFVLVLAYLTVDFGRPQDWFTPIGLIRPGMIVLGSGMLLFFREGMSAQLAKPARLTMVFVLLLFVMVPFAPARARAFAGFRDMALLVFGAVLPMTLAVDSFPKLRKLFRYWVWLHVPLALYCITHNGRGIGSFLVDENDFCLALNMVLPYAVGLAIVATSKLERFSLLGVVALLLVAVTATMSRGGFLGLVGAGLALWLRSPRKMLSAILIVLFSGMLAVVTPSKYWTEMKTIETASEEGDTGHERLYRWWIAWQMFLDYPVFGVGAYNYQRNTEPYETEYEKARGNHVWGKASHSLYFTVLPETGIVGTVLWVMIIVAGVKDRRRILRTHKELLPKIRASDDLFGRLRILTTLALVIDVSLVGYLVTGTFLSVFYYPHFWLLTGFSVVTVRQFDAEIAAAGLVPSAPAAVRHAPVASSWRPPSRVQTHN